MRLLEWQPLPVHGIIGQPPCTEFAGSGARWWKSKGPDMLTAALAVSDACLRAVAIYNPSWWVLENPVGRLRTWYGPPKFSFHPHEFAADFPEEAYTKKTLLWGNFNEPTKCSVPPVLGSKMHRLPPTPDRAQLRSMTPKGFAQAWFEANP